MKAPAAILFAVGCAIVQPIPAANAATYTETVLYSFGGPHHDGQRAFSGLISVHSTLYGTTSGGGNRGCGAFGCGTAFSLDPSTGAEKVLYRFCSKAKCTDGDSPSSVIAVNNALYGTTARGGVADHGTVFVIQRDTGKEKVLYSFCTQSKCADGTEPFGGLVEVNGILYGTTNGGGSAKYGVVFSLDPNTGVETVIHAFGEGADGASPYSGMIEVNGMLYGTTYYGGETGAGTVFALDPSTNTEKVLYSFASQASPDGWNPYGGMVNVNGTLYGTTVEGGGVPGSDGVGTVFAFNPTTGTETLVHSFNGSDGRAPYAGLIAMKGRLYGTTASGGSADRGTVFSVDPATGTESVLHNFLGGADGDSPWANLVAVKDTLYGTTPMGGANGAGTVFSLAKKH